MCFRCGPEDHCIAIFPKPDTSDKKVHWNTENSKTCAYILTKIDKNLERSTYESDSKNMYTSMASMYTNTKKNIRN